MKDIRIRYHMETGIIKPERLTHLIDSPNLQIQGNEESGYSIDLIEVVTYIEWLEEQIKTPLI